MVLEIAIWPDKILTTVPAEVTSFDDDLKSDVESMIETLKASGGVSLAANQVRIDKQIIVLDVSQYETDDNKSGISSMVMINPHIESFQNEPYVMEEGCQSTPGLFIERPRVNMIVVRFQDITGKELHATFVNEIAFIVQHSLEYLEGTPWIQNLNYIRRKIAERTIKKTTKGK